MIEITLNDAFVWWKIEWEDCSFSEYCDRIKEAGFIII